MNHDQENASPGAALARIRHELRTPLNAIIGYGEILMEDAEDAGLDGLLEPLERIHRGGAELLALVQEHVKPVGSGDVSTLWTELRDLTRAPLEVVLAASTELLEAARTGAPEMVADVEKILSSGRKLKDGIESLVEHSPSSEIWQRPPEAAADRDHHGPKPKPELARGSVLVVDDQASNRDILARRLEKLGYDVTLADGGKAALEALTAADFDVVLLDVLMPDMDGYELLRTFKEDDARGHLPVIMISALDEIQGVARCIEMGAEDYLPKPFDPVLLRARVGSSIEKKRLRDKELLYLRHVAALTRAASELEVGRFAPESLEEVADRDDELGSLARVFAKMAGEVRRREEQLMRRVAELKIEIDQARKESQVSEITDSEYFRKLQAKASSLRRRIHDDLSKGSSIG